MTQVQQPWEAIIFDMDGLLIDSEPLWEQAGTALLQTYGCQLNHQLYRQTVGLRTLEWLQHWFHYFNLKQVELQQAEATIIAHVIQLVQAAGKPMGGVEYIFQYFAQKGIAMGLATSSPLSLAHVVIEKLGIGKYLKAVTSAAHLQYGKPHPQVYLDCAAALQANPTRCLCFEDSFNGMIAAKAAKMSCVVVPAGPELQQARWGAADLKISSLQNFNDLLFRQL